MQELLSAARWQPAKQVAEPKPQVNSGKIPNTNFTKREIAFVLLVIWWAVQDSNPRPPACKAGGNSI
jgi:hypothetical protein